MKIVVTHTSPDMDAITSVWLIKKFLPGWESAEVQFVPAGERLKGSLGSPRPLNDSSTSDINQPKSLVRQHSSKSDSSENLFKSSFRGGARPANYFKSMDAIEIIDDHEVIHVDTGLGPLDHHQTDDQNVCGASLTWEYVKSQKSKVKSQKSEKEIAKEAAIDRMVKVVVDTDHFKEVFWPNPTADYYEFSVGAVLEGQKLAKPNQDEYYVDFINECLDAILHEFENRIWAEKEIAENGHKFDTRFGKGIGFETINDSVIKLAQKMGYVIVIRKDPRKGYVRIKALPALRSLRQFGHSSNSNVSQSSSLARAKFSKTASKDALFKSSPHAKAPRAAKEVDIDLTLAYEKLRKMDPEATWFLHVGKKMLLNGSVKNPKMRPTRLGLGEIIKVLEKI